MVFIHRLFDREQQIGRALDLIDDRPVQFANETHRVGLRGFECCLVVEGNVGTAGLSHFSHQRRLTGTARSDDQHHWSVQEGFLGPSFDKSLVHVIPRP